MADERSEEFHSLLAKIEGHLKRLAENRWPPTDVIVHHGGPSGPAGPQGPRGDDGKHGGSGGSFGDGGASGGRYWEAYVVRYLAGTFIGLLAVMALGQINEPINREISEVLQSMPEHVMKDGWALIAALLIGVGFAFSYVASAPLYVLHLYRRYLFSESVPVGFGWSWFGLLVLTYLGLWLVVATMFVVGVREDASNGLIYSAVNALILGGLGLYALVGIGLFLRASAARDPISAYYRFIASERANTKVDAVPEMPTDGRNKGKFVKQEYIESYRHLREHGNAYAIVVMNFAFACVLSVGESMQELALLTAIWLIPAVLGWFVGTRLERQLDRAH